jgi:hypothetical protein
MVTFTEIAYDPATTVAQGQRPRIDSVQGNFQSEKSNPETMTQMSTVEVDAAKNSSNREPAKNIVALFVTIVTKSWTTLLNSTSFNFERLWIWDLRTLRPYSVPIKNGAVEAAQLGRISPLGINASLQDHIANGLLVSWPLVYI